MRFLNRFFMPPAQRVIPAGDRVYAIGDVHGCHDLLVSLVGAIKRDIAARGEARVQLIFLGDLVDRGPDSRGVVDLVMSLRDEFEVRLIKGNHEELFVAASRGDREAARYFYAVGGRETLLSYGFSQEETESGSLDEMMTLMAQRIPEAHIEFLGAADEYLQCGDYLFVHAGVRPGVPLEEQLAQEMRWIRAEFTRSTRDHGSVVVHGHSISQDVELLPNRIGVDTGAYSSGRLSAIGLEGAQRWVLTVGGS